MRLCKGRNRFRCRSLYMLPAKKPTFSAGTSFPSEGSDEPEVNTVLTPSLTTWSPALAAFRRRQQAEKCGTDDSRLHADYVKTGKNQHLVARIPCVTAKAEQNSAETLEDKSGECQGTNGQASIAISDDGVLHNLLPVRFGAAIVDETLEKCLMLQSGMHSWQGVWSHPCGTPHENEDEVACTVRLVLQEIGLDISSHIDLRQYIEATLTDNEADVHVKLFVVTGISHDTASSNLGKDAPKVAWIPMRVLPGWSSAQKLTRTESVAGNKFDNIARLMAQLKKWVEIQQRGAPVEEIEQHFGPSTESSSFRV